MTAELVRVARGSGPSGAAERRNVLLMSDRADGPDLLGFAEVLRPLAELCLSPGAETPFALGLVGDRGVGKQYALRRLVEGIEALARGLGRSGDSNLLSQVVVARVDAATEDDPASAIAEATFAALGRAEYVQLADEAAHATLDLRHATAAAAERHDEALRKLEQERAARDEVEAKRARIADALLFDTPGTQVDAFVRASRAKIEARLKRFGFVDGDPGANYRNLVRDLANLGSVSRATLFLRAIWSYRGQVGLLALATLAFALAFGLIWLREAGVGDELLAFSSQFGAVLDAVKSHPQQMEYTVTALTTVGVAALFVNIWRAVSFTGLLFRGLRLLDSDVRERSRELDASATRLERRIAALQTEAEAASQHSERLAQRIDGGGALQTRAANPQFFSTERASGRSAREFMRELTRAISAGKVPAPQRVFLVIENVDQSAPSEALRLLDVAIQLAGRSVAVIVACDLARLTCEPREMSERLFQIVFDVGAAGAVSGQVLASRIFSDAPTPRALSGEADTRQPVASEPLDDTEIRTLSAVSGLIGPNPSALKRLFNAYRLARRTDAPRALVALALAARIARDPDIAAALRWAFFSEGDALTAPSAPASLAAAFEAAVLPSYKKSDAQRAWAISGRYAPWPL